LVFVRGKGASLEIAVLEYNPVGDEVALQKGSGTDQPLSIQKGMIFRAKVREGRRGQASEGSKQR
jgi:hypothetical protein